MCRTNSFVREFGRRIANAAHTTVNDIFYHVFEHIVRNAVVCLTKSMADGRIDHHHHIYWRLADFTTIIFLIPLFCFAKCNVRRLVAKFRNFEHEQSDNKIFMSSCRFTFTTICKTTDSINKEKKNTHNDTITLCLLCNVAVCEAMHSHGSPSPPLTFAMCTSKCVTHQILSETRQMSSCRPFGGTLCNVGPGAVW